MIRSFNGKTPKIAKSAFISKTAYIIGDVDIGNFCIIAAGSLVGQGAKVPDKPFVTGIPRRVKKEVWRQQPVWTEFRWEAYFWLTKQYKKEGL